MAKTAARKDWNEDDHPRDPDGRFSGGGGGDGDGGGSSEKPSLGDNGDKSGPDAVDVVSSPKWSEKEQQTLVSWAEDGVDALPHIGDELDSMFEKSSLSQDTVLWRGLTAGDDERSQALIANPEEYVGKDLPHPTVTATSTKRNVAKDVVDPFGSGDESQGVYLKMSVSSGTPAIHVLLPGTEVDHANEVILQSGSFHADSYDAKSRTLTGHWVPKKGKSAKEVIMPLPKPHKGESKDDFISRCMHEAYGSDAPPDRTQEQAVAMCMSAWRQEHGGEPPKKATIAGIIRRWHDRFGADPPKKILQLLAKSEPDVPDPQPGEDEDDFIERCVDEIGDDVDEDQAETLCQMAWEESGQGDQEAAFRAPQRRHGGQDVVFKTHAGAVDGAEYVLSDETPDRMGDVIASDGWDLGHFKKNPIALFNHRSDFPVGTWSNLRVEGKSLRGHLKLAPEGTSQRIDEIRRLVDAGVLRAVSVGFVSVERKPREGKAPSGGYLGDHFTKVELVETSLVSVPANPNALAVAKGLRVSPATIDIVFAETGKRSTRAAARRSTGEVARTDGSSRRREPMSLSERIKAAQERITALREKLTEHLKGVDDTNVSDAQLEVTHELNTKIGQEEKALGALLEAEKHLAATAEDGHGGSSRQVTTATRATPGNGRTPFSLPKTKGERIDALIRAGCVQLLAHRLKRSTEEARLILAAENRSYDDEATRVLAEYSARAASAPAMTTVAGWAAELVQQIWADIMETLLPKSVFPRLSGLGLALNFGRAGRISIPTRSRTPTIAGSFVGEGAPIPVRQGQFTAQVLTPKKMAVITTWTREIDEHSMPAIEGLLRQAIQEDTAVSLDAILLDSNAATAVRPAGIFNGVTPLTPTAGGGLNALVGDIKQLSGAVLTATAGHIRNMAWLMNPQQVLSAGLTSAANTGIYPFKDELSQGRLMTYPVIDSGTVPLGTVGVIDAADFVAVGAEGPRFEISDQATLHMEDTTPAQIVGGASPGTAAFPTTSLWQTDSLALRLILPMNWTVRRPGVVALVQNVTW